MTNVLITGCGGFIGSYLAEFLIDKGYNVYGTVFDSTENIDHIKDKINTMKIDMSDKSQIETAVEKSMPDIVFHLAAQSFVIPSWQDTEGTLKTNILGTLYLFDAIRKTGVNSAIIIASSSACYGLTNLDEIPIKETKEFRPSSPYAVSKISADMLAYVYARAYGMKIIRARIFNTIGPRKKGNAVGDFAQMIAEAEKGKRSGVGVGNLDPVIDFTDVRDLARALWLLAEKGEYGEAYNICSGRGHKLSDILEKLISFANKKIDVYRDEKKIRPIDDPVFIGDNTKIKRLGWTPTIKMEDTLKDTLNYWRTVIR